MAISGRVVISSHGVLDKMFFSSIVSHVKAMDTLGQHSRLQVSRPVNFKEMCRSVWHVPVPNLSCYGRSLVSKPL